MELAAAILPAAVDGIEAVAPVYTQQTEHRQEDTYADAGGALEVEGVNYRYPRSSYLPRGRHAPRWLHSARV